MARPHGITITAAEGHVEVTARGETVAKSDRAVVLRETGLRPRYYLPRDDVRLDLLVPSRHRTTCPFKGEASYWSLRVGDDVLKDVVWTYEDPRPGREAIAGLLCFYNERVDLTVDGQRR